MQSSLYTSNSMNKKTNEITIIKVYDNSFTRINLSDYVKVDGIYFLCDS